LIHVVDAAAAALDLTGGIAHVLRGDVDANVLNRFKHLDPRIDQRAVYRIADGRDDLCRTTVDGVLVELGVVEAQQRALDRFGSQRPVVESIFEAFDDELHRLIEVLNPLRLVDKDVGVEDVFDIL